MIFTSILTLAALGFLIAVSLIYGRDLENGTLLKYWAIFILGVAIIRVPFNSPFIAGVFGMAVAFFLMAKAKFPSNDY